MNRRRGLSATAVALLAAAALVGVPAVRPAGCPVPERPDGRLPAQALARPVPVRGCGLADAVVVAGALAVAVPRTDGEWVVAAGSAGGGHPALLAVERAGGTVRAMVWRPDGAASPRAWRPDGEPAPPPRATREPVARLGRVEPGPATDAAGPPAAPHPEIAPTATRCADAAGAWLGMRWQSAYRWSLRARGVPAYLGSTDRVRDAIRAAASALDDGRNDCGYGGGLGLSQRYVGHIDRDTGIRPDGGCSHRDQRNVVAFGELSGGLLALTCLWWVRGRTVEADVRISHTPGLFTLDPDPAAGCTARWDLQGTLTHEFGHVFGLGHVTYAEHGEQTMSDGLPPCSARMRTLGLGDYLALRAQYGTD
jgi:hypothetical protein